MSERYTPKMECVFDAESIAARVRALAADVRAAAGDRTVVVLGILYGAAVFATDLVRALEGPKELAFVRASSYGRGTESTGRVELGALDENLLAGRYVLVADTILDTGLTLRTVLEAVRAAGAGEVAGCVLLDKPARRTESVEPEFVGFVVEDRFLVGYGLDHAGRHRALPYVGVNV